MISLDNALKTFLIWKGIAHLTMAGYAIIVAYLLLSGYHLGASLTTQQTFIITTATALLPVMLNWYTGVMASTVREPK